MMHRGLVIPDQAFFILAGIIMVLTWIAAFLMHPVTADLTAASEVTVTYISITDSIKFPIYFLFPLFELILFIAFTAFYHTPEQAALRRNLKIGHVAEPQRSMLMKVYRHFVVMILVLLELVVTFMFLSNFVAITDVPVVLNGWALVVLIAVLMAVVGMYWSWMSGIAHQSRPK